jgi:uncharacterized protein YndB with AHSA1/START domain
MGEPDRVLVEILVAAHIDTVWRALRDPVEIKRWFGWDYAGLAEEVQMVADAVAGAAGADASGPERTLRVTGMADRFSLQKVDDGHTVVRIIRSAPVTDASWTGIYDDTVEGWLMFAQQLRFMLERHPGADRRTLFLNGRTQAPGTPLPLEALGLIGVASVPIGARYSANVGPGDTLAGIVWHRAANQLGLTVDGYGDGLIIVNTRPTTDTSPYGGGTILITTYGIDDRTYARLRDRWSAWWRERYETIEVQPEVGVST